VLACCSPSSAYTGVEAALELVPAAGQGPEDLEVRASGPGCLSASAPAKGSASPVAGTAKAKKVGRSQRSIAEAPIPP